MSDHPDCGDVGDLAESYQCGATCADCARFHAPTTYCEAWDKYYPADWSAVGCEPFTPRATEPTGHLCVRCLCNDWRKNRCTDHTWATNEPPTECEFFAERKDKNDQTVYFVFCRPGDPQKANREWPTCPDGQAICLGLDPQRENLEVWLWFVPVGVDVSGLERMPFVESVQPVATRYARLFPNLPF